MLSRWSRLSQGSSLRIGKDGIESSTLPSKRRVLKKLLASLAWQNSFSVCYDGYGGAQDYDVTLRAIYVIAGAYIPSIRLTWIPFILWDWSCRISGEPVRMSPGCWRYASWFHYRSWLQKVWEVQVEGQMFIEDGEVDSVPTKARDAPEWKDCFFSKC